MRERNQPSDLEVAGEEERTANGYDLVSFGLQLVQVIPQMAGLLGAFCTDVWTLRMAIVLMSGVIWLLAIRLSTLRGGHAPRSPDAAKRVSAPRRTCRVVRLSAAGRGHGHVRSRLSDPVRRGPAGRGA